MPLLALGFSISPLLRRSLCDSSATTTFVSLESPSRAYHHVLGLFSVAIIERTEGTGTRWTVGAEPTEKVSRGLPSTSTNPGQRLLRGFDDPGQKYEAKDRKGRRLAEGAAGCIWGCSPESLARPEGQT